MQLSLAQDENFTSLGTDNSVSVLTEGSVDHLA